MARDANAVAASWAAGLQSAGQKITEGVQAVQVAPGQAAARQADVWAAQVAASKDKWKRNTAAVSLQDWQTALIEKGVPRIAQGATSAQPKFAAFMSQLLPFIDTAKASLPPRGNLEQNITRSNTFIRKMATFKKNV